MAHAQKPDFVFRRNGLFHLNRRGASVQSTTGSRGVRIGGSNAGYTLFRGSVKSTGCPLHSPVSPFTSPPVRHCVPSRFKWSLPTRCNILNILPSAHKVYFCVVIAFTKLRKRLSALSRPTVCPSARKNSVPTWRILREVWYVISESCRKNSRFIKICQE